MGLPVDKVGKGGAQRSGKGGGSVLSTRQRFGERKISDFTRGGARRGGLAEESSYFLSFPSVFRYLWGVGLKTRGATTAGVLCRERLG